MAASECCIEGCCKPVKSRRMCSMHAERVRVHGDPHYKKSPAHDLSGMVFGSLRVMRRGTAGPSSQVRWECLCACGEITTVIAANLTRGHTVSCGCRRVLAPNRRTHGMTRTPTYRSWVAMRRRCSDQDYIEFHLYGGRGIKVCDRWNDSFEAFLADMGERPDGRTLDRVDPDGDYAPDNCRWATASEQARNRRRAA
jgi:hypothetical protein